MVHMARAVATALLAIPLLVHAEDNSGQLIDRTSGVPIGKGIDGLLIDSAAGSVSAASLAGVEGEQNAVVDNIRDLSVLLKGLDSSKVFGLAITPARTTMPIPRINLSDYAKPEAHFTRLLAAVTFSYAQGKSDVEGRSHDRRAFSIETSGFWNLHEDPVVAVAENRACGQIALDALGDDKPSITAADAQRLADAARQGGTALDQEKARHARKARRAEADVETAATAAYNTCIDGVLQKLSEKWNRTRYSLSVATGSIKPSDGVGDSHGLGRTLAVGLVYGFDGIDALGLKDRAAATLTVRRSSREPVLESLVSGPARFKDSTLLAARLSGGSGVFRGLAEWSNAKDGEVTSTQRTFRRALGIDYRVMKGLWLNLRVGKQRKIDGSGDEAGSFLLLNYSPSATLGR